MAINETITSTPFQGVLDAIPEGIPSASFQSVLSSIPKGEPAGFSVNEEPKEYSMFEGWYNSLTGQTEEEVHAEAYNIIARSELEGISLHEVAIEDNVIQNVYEDPTMKEALDMRVTAIKDKHQSSKRITDASVAFSNAYISGDELAKTEAGAVYTELSQNVPKMDYRIGQTQQWWARSTTQLTGQLQSRMQASVKYGAAGAAAGSIAPGGGTVAGMGTGFSVGMLSEMFLGTLGSQTISKVNSGMDEDLAFMTSIPTAIVIAASEMFVLGNFVKNIPGVKDIMAKTLATSAKQVEKKVFGFYVAESGKAAAHGIVQEGLQNIVEDLGTNFAVQLSNDLHGTNLKESSIDQILEDAAKTMNEVGPGLLILSGLGNSLGYSAETINRKADERASAKRLTEIFKNTTVPEAPKKTEIRDDLGQKIETGETVPTTDSVVSEDGDSVPAVEITKEEQAIAETGFKEPVVTSEEFDNLVMVDEDSTDQAIDDLYANMRSTGDRYGDFISGIKSVLGKKQAKVVEGLIEARAKATNRTKEQLIEDHQLAFRTSKSKSGDTLGSVEFIKDGETIVRAFQKTTLKDITHEVAHIFRKDLSESELKAAEKAFNIKDGNWTVEAEEAYAEGFVQYVATGKAPSKALAKLYDKLKLWLANSYSAVSQDAKISPEITAIFDAMLSETQNNDNVHRMAQAKAETHTLFSKKGEVKKLIRETTGQLPVRSKKVVDEHTAFKEALKQQVKAARKAASEGNKEGYAKAKAKLQATARRVANRSSTLKGRDKAIKAIKNTLRKARPKTSEGGPVGQFTADFQVGVTTLTKILSMSVADAKAKLEEYDASPMPSDFGTSQETLERALLEVRANMARMDASNLELLNADLKDFLNTGRALRHAEIARTMEGVDQAQADITESQKAIRAKSDMSENRRRAYDTETRGVRHILDKMWKAVRNNTVLDYHGLLEMLDIGIKSAIGEGPARLFAETIKQENKSNSGRKKHTTDMSLAYANIFGVTGDSIKQTLKNAKARMFEESRKNKVPVTVYEIKNKKGDKTGKRAEIKGTIPQLRKFWMELQDPLILAAFIKDGMSKDVLITLDGVLSKEDKAFAKYQLDFYAEYFAGVDEVYSLVRGVHLGKTDTYSPILRDLGNRTKDGAISDLLQDMNKPSHRGVGSRSLKQRVNNVNTTVIQGDIDVFNQYVRQMEHFKAFAIYIKRMNGVFKNEKIRQEIEDTHGKGFLDTLDTILTSIATNGTSGTTTKFDKVARSIRANLARGLVGGKILALPKQLTSMVAYSEVMGNEEFINGMFEFLKNPKKNSEELYELSEFIRNRADNIDRDVSLLTNSSEYTGLMGGVISPNVNDMIMMFVKSGDIGAIYAGGWVMYKSLREQGMSKEDAIYKMERFSRDTQQSSELGSQSLWQQGNEFMKLFTMFTSSQRQYSQKMAIALEARRAEKITNKEFAKKLVLYSVVLPTLFQVMTQGGLSDEEDAKAAMTASLAAPLSAIPVVNGAWKFLLSDAIQGHTYGRGAQISPILSPFDSMVKGKNRAMRMEDFSMEETLVAIREMSAATEYAGIPGRALGGAALGTYNILTGDVQEGALEVIGMSPYAAKKRASK